ncbi:MAG: metal-dependent transcriptional regulator [Armatimonadota bacterium]|nr:metal-dependent transcriptional regulator [Armatimonadota bacterium]
MRTHDIAKTEKREMYVKSILTLELSAPPATITKIADYLGVSPPSAWEMLKRLEQLGLAQANGEGITLTVEGKQMATQVLRRLRLAERLLTDILGMSLDQVYREACKLEHAIGPTVEDRLAQVLGNPRVCPHGHPIPDAQGRLAPFPALTLSTVPPGKVVVISCVPEEDEELLGYLMRLGLVPGAQVIVEEVTPFNGPLILKVGSTRHAIGRDVAARIRVQEG